MYMMSGTQWAIKQLQRQNKDKYVEEIGIQPQNKTQ